MEIGHTLTGCERSRREQGLLLEELAERERALRDTRTRGFHEMEELKRAHELRVDECERRRSQDCRDVPRGYYPKLQTKRSHMETILSVLGRSRIPKSLVVNIFSRWDQNQERFSG